MRIATDADTGEETRAGTSIKARQRRLDRAPRGGAERPVQNVISYESKPSLTSEKPADRVGLSRIALQGLREQQRAGYLRAGKKQPVKTCGTLPVISNRVALGVTEAGNLQVCGLQRCASRWCPDCWGKVAQGRAEDIQKVVTWAHEQGYRVCLATLTASHITTDTRAKAKEHVHEHFRKTGEWIDEQTAGVIMQDTREIFDGLAAAWRYAHTGRGGAQLREQRIGYARAFELTLDGLGARLLTGTHGHFHALLILDPGADLASYEDALWERWREGCRREKLTTSKEGYDFKVLKVNNTRHVKAAASYLVKGEKLDADKIGLEVARGDMKSNRGRGRTSPEGLLRAIGALEEDALGGSFGRQVVARWRAIEEACQGRRWLTWSRDIRKLAGLGAEATDEELANTAEPVEGDTVAVVAYDQVKEHLDEIGERVAGAKKPEKFPTLLMCLDSLGLRYVECTQTAWNEEVRATMSERSQRRRRRAA
jgi:hypothetical protein